MNSLVDNLLQKPSDGLHATFLRSILYGKVTPFRKVEWYVCLVTLLLLTELLLGFFWNDAEDLIHRRAFRSE